MMTDKNEILEFELQMHNNVMNSCYYQNRSGSCSFYNESYCIYEENQEKCLNYISIIKMEEFIKNREIKNDR